MTRYVIGALLVIGCGNVRQSEPDAAVSVDAPTTCTVHDTIESCGATCMRCPAGNDRATPTCDGTACGLACVAAAPRCTDNSCSRLTWTFDANMVDGITLLQPAGVAIAVRNLSGNLALAIPGVNLVQEVRFKVPVCLSGTTQLQTRTLSAAFFLEGGNDTGDQYFIQAAVPAPVNGAFLAVKAVPSNVRVTYSAPISMSQFANTAADIVFQVGTLGAQFSGTVWVDDIKIE